MAYRIIKAKFPGKCKETGADVKEGDLIWWQKFPKGSTVLATTEPSELDEFSRRRCLKRSPIQYLQQMCFDRGINSRHGDRHLVYHARKEELIAALMGEEVTWVKRRKDGTPGPKPEPTPEPEQAKVSKEDLAKMLDELLENKDFSELIEAAVAKQRPREIVVKLPEGKKVKVGMQHERFDKVLSAVSRRLHVFLVGPAGTGKTYMGEQIANALGIDFHGPLSVELQTGAHELMGHIDPQGNYHSTDFRRAFENGGVYFLDEVDKGNPNLLAKFNAALACNPGQQVSFPDGPVKCHKDFVAMAAGNTYGMGADREFVGSVQMDAATRNRFVFIEIGTDEKLEQHICESKGYDLEWMRRVQKYRHAASKLGARVCITPRSTFHGAELLQDSENWTMADVEESCVWQGIAEGVKEEIKRTAGL